MLLDKADEFLTKFKQWFSYTPSHSFSAAHFKKKSLFVSDSHQVRERWVLNLSVRRFWEVLKLSLQVGNFVVICELCSFVGIGEASIKRALLRKPRQIFPEFSDQVEENRTKILGKLFFLSNFRFFLLSISVSTKIRCYCTWTN